MPTHLPSRTRRSGEDNVSAIYFNSLFLGHFARNHFIHLHEEFYASTKDRFKRSRYFFKNIPCQTFVRSKKYRPLE